MPVSVVSAMLRSAFHMSQAIEMETAKVDGRARATDFYKMAVELIANGHATGLCLELSNPKCTIGDELAAVLVSNVAAIAGGGGGAGAVDGGGARSAFWSSTALLLAKEGEGAAEIPLQHITHLGIQRRLRSGARVGQRLTDGD